MFYKRVLAHTKKQSTSVYCIVSSFIPKRGWQDAPCHL